MRWIIVLALGVLELIAGSDDIPTYFVHQRCGQSINLRRESVFMAKIELLPVFDTSGLDEDEAKETPNKYDYVSPCIFNIESWSFQNRLMVNFEKMSSASEGCSKPSLEIFDGPSEQSPRITGLSSCRTSDDDVESLSFATTDIHLTFRYHGDGSSRFHATIVAFHEGPCRSYEHQCPNGRCIMSELVCNGHNPCGDFSDCPVTEPPQEIKTTRESDNVMVIAMASTSASVLAMIVCGFVLFKCYRLRLKHRRLQRNHENFVISQGTAFSPTQIGASSPQPAYERTVSQIEAEIRLAPPSYSQLPVIESDSESETSDNKSIESTNNQRNIDILPLHECLDIDENNPPSYACVMLHQDDFNVSELNIHDMVAEYSDKLHDSDGNVSSSGNNGDET